MRGVLFSAPWLTSYLLPMPCLLLLNKHAYNHAGQQRPVCGARVPLRRLLLLQVLQGATLPMHVRDVGHVGRQDQRGQRDAQLAGSQHQAVPQVQQAGREERRLQPGDVQVWAGEPLCSGAFSECIIALRLVSTTV
jgi:hypothetical protein